MSTENEELENKSEEENREVEERRKSLAEEHDELIKSLVQEGLNEGLKDIKGKLDSAFKARDEALKENARLKAQQAESEKRKLKDEGKHLEVATMQITELEERLKLKEEQLTQLSRDRELETAMAGLEFRNNFARETAFKTILSELTQDDDGTWIHKSGASLSDYIRVFSKDADKEFLFKPKQSSGAGLETSKGGGVNASKGRPASLKGLSTQELLKLAREGKLA